MDIVGAGNTNASENTYGWHDASLGICLLGDGNNNFVPVSPPKSGLFLNDYVKSLVNIYTVNNEKLLIAGINSNDLIIHKQIEREDKIRLIKVDPYDACAEIIYRNGQKSKYEFYYGGSYISQQTRILEVTPKMDKISIFKFDGTERLISVDDLLVDL